MATWPSSFWGSLHIILHTSLLLFVLNAAASTGATLSDPVRPSTAGPPPGTQHVFQSDFSSLVDFIYRRCQAIIRLRFGRLNLSRFITMCSVILGITLWKRRSAKQRGQGADNGTRGQQANTSKGIWPLRQKVRSEFGTSRQAKSSIVQHSSHSAQRITDAQTADPGLLRKHSTFKSYTTSSTTYPSIRTFYSPHPQADKLPSIPTPLPLLVFIHGLGGSLSQFNSLLTSLVNVAPCLGIDLPGCGLSVFSPASWDAYTPDALARLLNVVIRQHAAQKANQGVILIGHSLGASLAALVATSSNLFPVEVLALIGICPQGTPPSEHQAATFRRLLTIPTPIFDLWRAWDRRGGPDSASVTRLVGRDADIEVKRLQERFNAQSQTAVWRRMARGALPSSSRSEGPNKGMPGLEVWASLKIPLFLIGGEGDQITKIDQIVKIGRALGKIDRPHSSQSPNPSSLIEKVTASNTSINERPSQDENEQSNKSRTEVTLIGDNLQLRSSIPSYSRRRRILKTSILPAPASHALLYDPATYRTVAGLIHTFLYEHVDTRLSLGWQLQHLSTEGKWDVKNLAKWQAICPVSDPIAGIFRAMKTLREIDDTHSPDIFVRDWKGKIRAVIDISHESPVYDPKGLDEGGIEYHKFPTVSKIPPTKEEAREFIKLVDRLRAQSVHHPTTPTSSEKEKTKPLIGVHCHYGFNRTGFFICCYLIEKEGFGVPQAIDAFAASRPPGIRHEHFLDQLFVRYCIGLKRAPSL